MTPSKTEGAQPGDYDLAVDAQVEKFVEIKQKLTYFLITASVGVIAFMVSFGAENLSSPDSSAFGLESRLVILSSLAGLLAAGLSLLNLHLGHKSYALHLDYRYKRKDWDSLSVKQQKSWDRINKWAAYCLEGAFVALFVEIGFAVAAFMTYFG